MSAVESNLALLAGGGGGAHRDPFDPKDHYYNPNPVTLPESKDLRKSGKTGVTPVYNQYVTGSCTANAAAAAFWFEEIMGRHEADWGTAGPSRLFIYWLARALGERTNDEDFTPAMARDGGSCMRNAMKGIAMRGACPEGDCPFPNFDDIYKKVEAQGISQTADWKKFVATAKTFSDPIVNAKPSGTAYQHASPHTITNYYRIDIDRPYTDDPKVKPEEKEKSGQDCLRKVKQCISEGYPVAFSYWYYLPGDQLYEYDTTGKWDTKGPNNTTTKMIKIKDIWNDPNSSKLGVFPRHTWVDHLPQEFRFKENLGGHSVLAIGYDDKNFIVQNSWGTSWSNGGVFLMPYAWVSDFAATNDFWTVRVHPVQPAAPTAAPVHWEQVQNQVFGN